MADDFEIGAPLPEESSNRTFVIAVIVMGGLLVVSIICLVVYAFVLAPRQQEQQPTRVAEINLENTQQAASQTAAVIELTPSRTPTAATQTEEPTATATATSVVVLPTFTPTPFLTLPTVAPETATAAAQATLAAAQGGGGATPTATALPATGFADEIGVPTLAILAGFLLAIIVIARSLRARVAT